MTVRAYAAAAVNVGIDQRRERLGRFAPRIELHPQFGRDAEIRPPACGDDDLVDILDARMLGIALRAFYDELVVLLAHGTRAE